jgi:hypothetical protein
MAAQFSRAATRFVLPAASLLHARDHALAIVSGLSPEDAAAYLRSIAIPAFRAVANAPGGPRGNTLRAMPLGFSVEQPQS